MKNGKASVMLLVLVALIYSSDSSAAMTIGNRSCGDWIDARKAEKSTNEYFARQVIEAWIVGYLSGVNSALPVTADALKNTDANSIWAWMDNYCSSNPLSTIGDGGDKLIFEVLGLKR